MWQFFIDVGGTFTDVVAVDPNGALLTHKLLSSGVVRGTVMAGSTSGCLVDSARIGEPAGFWVGYEIALRDARGALIASGRVSAFDGQAAVLSWSSGYGPRGVSARCAQTRRNRWPASDTICVALVTTAPGRYPRAASASACT